MQALEKMIGKISGLTYLVARVAFGLFIASHGYAKLMDLNSFIGNLGGMGFPLPKVLGPIAMAAELAGGILIAVGFKTRIAALFVLITMIVAVLHVHGADSFQKKELALIYAVGALLLMSRGSGRFSLDKDI